ncbi:uncharacterized protein NPIL_291901 [Nephila pilipes]|uniref:Uncharacterized protein n=1 Tax=Nephila pilipes TaxID=299642 RepID=A0A8X6NMV9_NEPPI|nr:uncharacterized protein NPIL_291901 [Nephila pilipes]
MANIEALRKSRKLERADFTKAYNRVEELIALESVDICKLEAELNVFKGKVDRLENTHSNILELLPEKEYDAELEVVEDFRDKAIRIQKKARRIINGQQNVSSVLNSTNDDSVVINSVENVVVDKNDDLEQVTSVLGLIWNRKEDELKINLDWIETYKLETVPKRVILSVTRRFFDPIGFLCPVLLIPKLMLQKMWKDMTSVGGSQMASTN